MMPRWIMRAAIAGSICALSYAGFATRSFAEEAKAKVTFAPETEAKITEFFGKLKEITSKRWYDQMTKTIEEIVKVTGLSADGAKTLEAPAKKAVELAAETGIAKTEEAYRKQFVYQQEEMAEMIDQMTLQIETIAQNSPMGGDGDPTEQPVWAEALQRTLSPEQLATWKKAMAARLQTLEAEVADALKSSSERVREQITTTMHARCATMKAALGLSDERAQQLAKLAEAAVEKSVAAWSKQTEKALIAMPDKQRRMMARSGNLFFIQEGDQTPEKQAVWKDGLAKLLTPEEVRQLQSAQDENKSRRVRVLGQMMLALLDEKVAFTASQRERLQPIAERLMKTQPTLFPEGETHDYFSFNPPMFFAVGAQADDKELAEILDPIQRGRWREASSIKSRTSSVRKVPQREKSPEPKPTPVAEPEPEVFEQVVSDFFYEKSDAERKEHVARMTLKAEDAARVANLSADAAGRLQTAARGAAELSLTDWKNATVESIRSMLSEATPRNVKQTLDSMDDYQFRRGDGVLPEKQTVWEQTIKATLSDEQRAAWQTELQAREDFREKAIATVVLVEFDRRHSLTAEQWGKLEPMVRGFLREYGPDITSMFSSNNETPWYLQSYSMFTPFAGLPEKEFQEVIGKEKWDRWSGSEFAGNANSYWENVRQNHEQRVKRSEQ